MKDGDQWPTLGHQVANMIEATCVIPDGDHREEVYRLTNEMYRFLLHFYRLNPETRRFVYDRGGLLIRPQKWGKGPFAAAQTCAEARGPVLFDHWAEKGETDPWGFEFEKGEPVGRPWATPKIEITASSEDQAGNVWDVLLPMIELGSLKAEIPDTGVTRINLIGGGEIVPVTASPRSRLGQRVTFVVQDETHSWWKSNGGHLVADNQRRNVSGMKGRFLETTNAWDPIEESVAQATNANPIGVYVDDVDPGPGSVRNKKDRYKMYPRVYGDSWWIDFDRIDSEVQALIAKGEAQQAERFFLNRKIAQEGAAFEPDKWKRLVDATVVVPDQSLIVLGVNGSRSSSLAIVGTEVESGHQFVVGLWELPKGAEEGFEHPVHEIDGAMLETFDKYEVWRAYTYGNIATLAATWEGRWDKKIIDFPINSPTRMAVAVRNYVGAVNGGEFTTDGNSTMAAHIRHARKKRSTAKDPEDGRPMWTLAPDRPNSPRSIAGAIAGVLSWEARGDAIAAGATQTSDAVSGSF